MTDKVFIFDFDGTIADTHDAFIEIVNRLAVDYGYKPASGQEVARLKNLSSKDIIRESGVSFFLLPLLLRRIKNELNKKIEHLETFPDLHSCLGEMEDRGCLLGIVSSNSRENVIGFLENNRLSPLFSFIYTGTPLFSKHKIIDRLIEQRELKNAEIYYVGDETRDIQAARKSGVKSIAVAWGFNSPEILNRFRPDYLIHRPGELLEILENGKERDDEADTVLVK